jgi:hypothetical protein
VVSPLLYALLAGFRRAARAGLTIAALRCLLPGLLLPWGTLAVGMVLPTALAAQSTALEEDSQLSGFLDVRRQQVALKAARSELERVEKLANDGLVSQVDVDRSRVTVEQAQLSYQQAVLALLNLRPHLAVREAVKYQEPDGRQFVKLVVANLTPSFDDSQFELLNNFEGTDPIPAALKTRDLQDIFVSLGSSVQAGGASTGGNPTAIAIPYEQHIPNLAYGQSRALRYQLLRDVDNVVISTAYRGRREQIPVQLQAAETESVVTMTAAQISQEADLGSQVIYDLTLERSTVDVRNFRLHVFNLPQQISFSFLEPGTQARLSQIQFGSGVTRKTLQLRLFLPEQGGGEVRVDEPIHFLAVAALPETLSTFDDGATHSADEVAATKSGLSELAIIPRGVGRIEVSLPSLFSEIEAGGELVTSVAVKNAGTRRLDNVKVNVEAPLNWIVEIEPSLLPALAIGEEARIDLVIRTPESVSVGDYELRIKTESYANNRQIPTEDKLYRISVKGRTRIVGPAILVLLLLAVLFATLYIGVKLTRR